MTNSTENINDTSDLEISNVNQTNLGSDEISGLEIISKNLAKNEKYKPKRINYIKLLNDVEKKYFKKDTPFIQVGDTVRCGILIKEGNKERTQYYEGIVIGQKKNNKGLNWNFTVRRIMQGIGIERIFLVHSPKLVSLIVKSSARVRRAKLYYLRALSGKASRLQQQFD